MESNIWLEKFKEYLSEYGSTPSEIDEIILNMDAEIKFAHERNADAESAAIRIGKEFFKAKMEVGIKETFEHYSTHHPKLYSLQHCLDVVINRLVCIHSYLERVRPGSPFLENSTFKIGKGLTVCEEDHYEDSADDVKPKFTKLVKILSDRLLTTDEKILSISILRSKYSVFHEWMSMLSGIPIVILETGICRGEAEYWDNLSLAIDPLFNKATQLFLTEYAEPIGLEELIEDLHKAQEKGFFDIVIISGLTYCNGNDKDEFFAESSRMLGEFARQCEVEVLVLP